MGIDRTTANTVKSFQFSGCAEVVFLVHKVHGPQGDDEDKEKGCGRRDDA